MEPNDKRWSSLKGGYGAPYDPRGAMRRVAAGDDAAWSELWQELHHQGDVGEASYGIAIAELAAAVGHELVDSLIATVALAKGRRTLARMAMLTEDEREETLGTGWG